MRLVRYIRSDEGSVAIVMGMLLPLIVGMGGVGVDVGHWMQERRLLQTATDAAARAGAHEIANGRDEADAIAAAIQEAGINGGDVNITADDISFPDNDANGNHQVVVTTTKNVDVWLAKVFYSQGVTAAATATAEVSADGRFCFLSLNPTIDDAVTVSGTADIEANGCGIAINSSSDTALNLNGNPIVNVGELKIVGDTEDEDGVTATSILTNTSPTADPYADLEIEDFTGCSQAAADAGPTAPDGSSAHYSGNVDVTLQPGVYCGGIDIGNNGVATLSPGTYIMDGGDFNVTGSGSLIADGVTIILTDSTPDPTSDYGTFSATGGKDMYFKAPTDGPYAGIAVYQDRNTPESASSSDRNFMGGTAGMTLDGVFYAPSRPIEFGGDGASDMSSGETCSKIISYTISFAGTPDLGSNCSDSGTTAIGVGIVRLVN
jgi:Flp pilus assembly protein TadG